MRTIAVVNQKGGCGKTITAINVSSFLALAHRKVLLIDMDPQGHATLGLQTDADQAVKTISDVLLRDLTGEKIWLRDVTRSVQTNLDLIPANILLSAVPEQLAAVVGREHKLAQVIDEVRGQFHYVIIDCPPNIGLLTFNALMACSEAIIPLDPSFFSLHGIGKLLETLDILSRKKGHEIEAHALITLYTGRTEFVKEVAENIRKHLCNRVFATIIRHSVKLAEAASHGLPISGYCSHCAGYEDYRMLVQEILAQEGARPVLDIVDQGSREVGVKERGMLQGILSPSAPIPTGNGVLFSLEAPGARCVQLAGDFNSWIPDGNEMAFSGGLWRKIIPLPPGRYRYRYVVDGFWLSDPENSLVEPSPYGDLNSVIVLDQNSLAK